MIDFVNRVNIREVNEGFEKEQNALATLSRAIDKDFARAMTAKLIPEREDRDVIRRVVR